MDKETLSLVRDYKQALKNKDFEVIKCILPKLKDLDLFETYCVDGLVTMCVEPLDEKVKIESLIVGDIIVCWLLENIEYSLEDLYECIKRIEFCGQIGDCVNEVAFNKVKQRLVALGGIKHE